MSEQEPKTVEYKGFEGRYEWDEDTQAYFGEVVNIPKDVVTFQGTTPEETEQAFRDSVDDYLGFCRERGEEPEQAKR